MAGEALAAKDFEKALSFYKEVQSLDSSVWQAWHGEIEVALQRHEFVAALELSEKASVMFPECEWFLIQSFLALKQLGKVQEAHGTLNAAALKAPCNPTPFIYLADLSLESLDLPQARRYAEEALTRDPSNVWANLAFARCLSKEWRFTEMAETCLAVAKKEPYIILSYELVLTSPPGELDSDDLRYWLTLAISNGVSVGGLVARRVTKALEIRDFQQVSELLSAYNHGWKDLDDRDLLSVFRMVSAIATSNQSETIGPITALILQLLDLDSPSESVQKLILAGLFAISTLNAVHANSREQSDCSVLPFHILHRFLNKLSVSFAEVFSEIHHLSMTQRAEGLSFLGQILGPALFVLMKSPQVNSSVVELFAFLKNSLPRFSKDEISECLSAKVALLSWKQISACFGLNYYKSFPELGKWRENLAQRSEDSWGASISVGQALSALLLVSDSSSPGREASILKRVDINRQVALAFSTVRSEERSVARLLIAMYQSRLGDLPLPEGQPGAWQTLIQLCSRVSCFRPMRQNVLPNRLRIAVLVTGKMRAPWNVIPSWKRLFKSAGGNEFDFFVSTWETGDSIPWRADDWAQVFPREVQEEVRRFIWSFGAAALWERYPSLMPVVAPNDLDITEKFVADLYGAFGPIVFQEILSEAPLAGKSTVDKMFYTLQRAMSRVLASDKEYDLVVRIRPDGVFRSETQVDWSRVYSEVTADPIVFCDRARRLVADRSFFFMGDQFAVSTPDVMWFYTHCAEVHELCKAAELSAWPDVLSGHAGLSWLTWLFGLTPRESPELNLGLLRRTEIITSDTFASIIRKDGSGRVDDLDVRLSCLLENRYQSFHTEVS